MGSDIKTGLAVHNYGSKHWIQVVVNNTDLCKRLNKDICENENLAWISPLKNDNYIEYHLIEDKPIITKDLLNLKEPTAKKDIFSFWPTQGLGPQWDGIAISDNGEDIYLIEAKAHTKETESACGSKENSPNRSLIERSMHKTFDAFAKDGDFDNWMSKYYQLGNRLTFMYFLNKSELLQGKRFHIVLLNFANDPHFTTSVLQWEAHYKEVWKDMIGDAPVPELVHQVYFDVKDIK